VEYIDKYPQIIDKGTAVTVLFNGVPENNQKNQNALYVVKIMIPRNRSPKKPAPEFPETGCRRLKNRTVISGLPC
jgi:hypothetical protein